MSTSGLDWSYVAKVSDFGLSVRVDEFFGHVSNAHHGTPFYMAPEVTQAGFLSMAADSYSFGALSHDQPQLFACIPVVLSSRQGSFIRSHPWPNYSTSCIDNATSTHVLSSFVSFSFVSMRLGCSKLVPRAGVMMWEVLNGTPPYMLSNQGSRPVQHPAFPSFPRSCPLSFSSLATACLAPEPSARPNFHQIYEALDDLHKHLLAPSAGSATLAVHVPLHALQTRTAQQRAEAAAAAATVGHMHGELTQSGAHTSAAGAFP
jgi:serine/threonine protein kinase